MADLTMDDLTIGAIVFDIYYTWRESQYTVRGVEVVGPLHRSDNYIPMLDRTTGKLFKLYPGDRGIAPAAYDNRVTQVFKKAEDALEAIDKWRGRNFNFISKHE